MTERTVTHSTFVVERTYDATPARVFAAFADPAIKSRWFGGGDNTKGTGNEFDFREGGREINRGAEPGGPSFSFEALYHDIVPNQRIVTTYEMQMDGKRLSVSVSTVELLSEGAGTRMIYTEQGAFLDGHDDPALREKGTRDLLEALDAELRRESADA